AAGARLPAQATGRSLVEALDVVSRRPSTRSLATADRAGVPASTLRASLGLRPHGSLAALRALWDRITWRGGDPAADAPRGDEPELGQPARQFLREANYLEAAVWIIARLAEGLDHAHTRGLLHRDLKPSNILIAADGTPMLLDFNLAAETGPPDADGGA